MMPQIRAASSERAEQRPDNRRAQGDAERFTPPLPRGRSCQPRQCTGPRAGAADA